jgi:hypothetical protein
MQNLYLSLSYIITNLQFFLASPYRQKHVEGSVRSKDITAFWHMTPCSMVEVDRRFRCILPGRLNERGNMHL